MAGEPVRDWMLGVVGASIETAASSYPTEAEREAFPSFLQARRRLAEGAYARALELVAPLARAEAARRNRVPPPAPGRDGDDRGAVEGSMLARSGRACGRSAPAAEIKDEQAGIVRLAVDLRGGDAGRGPRAAARQRAGRGRVSSGRAQAGDRAGLPEQAPALRIEFAEGRPGVAGRRSRSSSCARPSPSRSSALSFAGYSLLALGDLRQSSAFAGVPLHGLERDLVQVQSVQKAVLVAGSLADARRAAPGVRAARGPEPGRVDDRAASGSIPSGRRSPAWSGTSKSRVSGDRRAPTEPPALDLRLPPGVVVRSLSIELPLVPRRSE